MLKLSIFCSGVSAEALQKLECLKRHPFHLWALGSQSLRVLELLKSWEVQ